MLVNVVVHMDDDDVVDHGVKARPPKRGVVGGVADVDDLETEIEVGVEFENESVKRKTISELECTCAVHGVVTATWDQA